MIKALGYAANHAFSRLKPLAFERDEAGADEVEIEIVYAGVCHSDVHQVDTCGGYSNAIVVKDDFVLKIPESIPIEAAAPILCADVTNFSPMKHWGVKAGDKVGIVGFGGFGNMAVKLAKAMGAEVTVSTTNKDKIPDAEKLGVTAVIEGDKDVFEALEMSFDLILSTIPEKHKVDPFVQLLKRDAAYVAVGALAPMPGWNHM